MNPKKRGQILDQISRDERSPSDALAFFCFLAGYQAALEPQINATHDIKAKYEEFRPHVVEAKFHFLSNVSAN